MQFGVEPVADLQVDAAAAGEAAFLRDAGQPDLQRAIDIAFQDARGIRIGRVEIEPGRGRPQRVATQAFGEVLADHQDAADLSGG